MRRRDCLFALRRFFCLWLATAVACPARSDQLGPSSTRRIAGLKSLPEPKWQVQRATLGNRITTWHLKEA
ncbi:uncharacterized protein P884DRAFT_42444 [Thermothelomyces heterothallicus CBS 202.75]|uniref:uncharacterized protein n=1 Tax=Thermothelomyces heterothallicus CBS 202.75 TaxID=1149848 RepID=UPI003743531F